MNRRRTIAAMLSLALAPSALAQAPDRVRRLGYLARIDDGEWLRELLAKFGHVEGTNFKMLVRNAETGPPTDAAADELIREKVDVLVAFGDARILTLSKRTRTIPIVSLEVTDPVALGLAQSLGRPGGNVTGICIDLSQVADGLIALLRMVVPRLQRIVVVLGQGREGRLKEGLQIFNDAATKAGIAWEYVSLGQLADYEKAFARIQRPDQVVAWLTAHSAGITSNEISAFFKRVRIATFAGGGDEWVQAGALMSYERTFSDMGSRVGSIIDKLLRGANPAEIPFEVPDRTEFTLNRATARALGLKLPPEVLMRVTSFVDDGNGSRK